MSRSTLRHCSNYETEGGARPPGKLRQCRPVPNSGDDSEGPIGRRTDLRRNIVRWCLQSASSTMAAKPLGQMAATRGHPASRKSFACHRFATTCAAMSSSPHGNSAPGVKNDRSLPRRMHSRAPFAVNVAPPPRSAQSPRHTPCASF